MFDKIDPIHTKRQDLLDVLACKLEYSIGDIKLWGCDGIYLDAVPIDEFLEYEEKDIKGNADINSMTSRRKISGFYKVIIMFGEKAIEKYTEVKSLVDCIQNERPQDEWLHIDFEKQYLEIQLL